jgi:hypothetical protein
MAVVFAERPFPRVADTLAVCVGAQLAIFAIPEDRIASEVAALRSATFGKNRDRSLLGILNEVAFQFEVAAADCDIASPGELLEVQTELNAIPHRAGSSSCMFAHDAIVGLPATCTGDTNVYPEPAKNRIGSGFNTGGRSQLDRSF